jgi:RNA polymerase sigma-70 factor (ECF subfamily)
MKSDHTAELDAMLQTAFAFRPEAIAVLAERIRCQARAEAARERRAKGKSCQAERARTAAGDEAATPALRVALHGCSEEQLLALARDNDATAFGELVSRHERRLMAAAMQIVRNRPDAEDIVQTACLNAFAHVQSFRGECAFATWLLRITVNEAIARSRETKRDQLNTQEINDFEEGEFIERPLGEWRLNPESLTARRELRDLLRTELERLPVKYAAVFLMRDVEGFSTAEVAEALNLSLTAVRVRLLRARSKLRERLRERFSGAGSLPVQRPAARGAHTPKI